tara:strand:+ start:4470 stop:5072 length:603 start_codon:yes stop_codon:yes gene_type:complete
MILARAKILRNPGFVRLGVDLEGHLESWIKSCEPGQLVGVLESGSIGLLRETFIQVGGCEGTVWLADQEEQNLVAVYNSGANADSLVGFEQPIGSGIISMVYAQQQPYCENDIGASHGHDDTLDRKIAKHTTAMIAVPFYFAFGLRGVISCVQLQEVETATHHSGFGSAEVGVLSKTVNVVERLINETLLSSALGLGDAG